MHVLVRTFVTCQDAFCLLQTRSYFHHGLRLYSVLFGSIEVRQEQVWRCTHCEGKQRVQCHEHTKSKWQCGAMMYCEVGGINGDRLDILEMCTV